MPPYLQREVTSLDPDILVNRIELMLGTFSEGLSYYYSFLFLSWLHSCFRLSRGKEATAASMLKNSGYSANTCHILSSWKRSPVISGFSKSLFVWILTNVPLHLDNSFTAFCYVFNSLLVLLLKDLRLWISFMWMTFPVACIMLTRIIFMLALISKSCSMFSFSCSCSLVAEQLLICLVVMMSIEQFYF